MKRMVMFSQDIGMWNGGANSLMLKVLLLPFLENFHLLLLNPLSLLMLPLPLPPRMLSLQQKLRALLLKTWEKILMLFLPYLNGQKKLISLRISGLDDLASVELPSVMEGLQRTKRCQRGDRRWPAEPPPMAKLVWSYQVFGKKSQINLLPSLGSDRSFI